MDAISITANIGYFTFRDFSNANSGTAYLTAAKRFASLKP